jgi:hypothetical protein
MHYLHDVHEINADRAQHVCFFVRMIQFQNLWRTWVKFFYGHYATANYPKTYFSISYNMADEQTCEVRSTLAPHPEGPHSGV